MPLTLTPVPNLPFFQAGDDLPAILLAALADARMDLADNDVLVIAQKIVSKAENRLIPLATVTPSQAAHDLALIVEKDPRLVQLILDESRAVLRARAGLLITEHRAGTIMANAGIDRSNIGALDSALLLPHDCDASAAAIRTRINEATGRTIAVIINDSFGRPWRRGTVGTALGAAGLPSLMDLRGHPDLFGHPLRTTEIAYADEIAAAASLLMGQADEARPAILIRGLTWSHPPNNAQTLLRPPEQDLFR